MMVVALSFIHWISGATGIGAVGDLLFCLYVAGFAVVNSITQTGMIPFSLGIKQPVRIIGGDLLDVFCAAVSAQMRAISALPATRIANTIAQPYFIQPAPPTRAGVHVCLADRLLKSPSALPRV